MFGASGGRCKWAALLHRSHLCMPHLTASLPLRVTPSRLLLVQMSRPLLLPRAGSNQRPGCSRPKVPLSQAAHSCMEGPPPAAAQRGVQGAFGGELVQKPGNW